MRGPAGRLDINVKGAPPGLAVLLKGEHIMLLKLSAKLTALQKDVDDVWETTGFLKGYVKGATDIWLKTQELSRRSCVTLVGIRKILTAGSSDLGSGWCDP